MILRRYDPLAGRRVGRPRVHAPRPMVGRLVCPLVRGLVVILFLRGSPDHVSSLSRPTTRVRVRPVIHDHQQEGADRLVVVSRRLSAAGVRFLGILFPSRSSAFLTVGLPARRLDPDGVSTFRTLNIRPGWAPSIARGRWCSSRPTTIIGLRLAHHSAVSLDRAAASITARLCLTSHQRGFKRFARPVFPRP